MGIKSINPFLKEVAPGAFMSLPLTLFQGKAIAIDAHLRIYEFISIATKSVIGSMTNPLDVVDRSKIIAFAVESLLEFNLTLCKYYITPVWVFDGPTSEFKKQCLINRKAGKTKKLVKIETQREELENKHVLKITSEDYQSFKKTLCQNVNVTYEDINTFKSVLSSLGYPILVAKSDGEKLCSSLNREGLVVAVWGNDTDNYALGTPNLISGFSGKQGNIHYVDFVRLETILDTLKIDLSFLTDFCIMCGCDFNDNIKGIGPKISYRLLLQFRNIDYLPQMFGSKVIDISVLNHHNCRQAFSYEPSEISSDALMIDWDNYVINIEKIASMFITRNKTLHLSFHGW
jgi:flap endonuclease-1